MDIIKGNVESLSKDRHGIKIGGTWYNNKFKTLPSDVVYGGQASLEVKDGKFWEKATGGGSHSTLPAETSESGGYKTHTPTRRSFPIDPNDAQRAIIRQNSLGHAVALINNGALDFDATTFSKPEDLADYVIAFARMFEAYSAGDIEAMIEETGSKKEQEAPVAISPKELEGLLAAAKSHLLK